jgi:hypothetical protein
MFKLKDLAPAAFLAAWLAGDAPGQTIRLAGEKQPATAAPVILHNGNGACCDPSGDVDGHVCEHPCNIQCLRPWTCEDLEMKPFEPKPSYCGCKGFFWCPPEEEEPKNGNGNGNGNGEKKNGNGEGEKKEGNGEKKEGNGEKKEGNGNGEKKEGNGNGNGNGNGEEEKAEEAPEPPTTMLMQAIQCYWPKKYDRMQKKGDNFYGWVWAGFTGNFDSPNDRVNFGTNFNWRSNDYRLDQIYFVYENTLEHEGEANVGYRVDFNAGHQAPFLVANGLFSDFTGFDPTSGYGLEGPGSFRELNRIGIDLPQFYLNAHIPHCITEKGIDIQVGKFYGYMGHEVYPGPLTEFYSHSYEVVYATPFTHTGVVTTVHATDTWDVMAGVVRGWDVFEDNNHRPSYHTALIWNSCDKRYNWTTVAMTGPEQFENDDNYRTIVSSYLGAKFGSCNQWQTFVGGHMAWEANAAPDSLTGNINDAEWHGCAAYLFYTVDPRLILGGRAEWFRDDDGVRTAVTGRPGFAADFYEITLGVTYKPYQNLRVRPEVRFDWSDGFAIDGSGAKPFNDLRDSFQTTAAIDIIWEF